MFERLEMAPSDPILGLTEAFRKDANPGKINLSVGVYEDDSGRTPVMHSVKKAEEKILRAQTTKNYLPINGPADYGEAVAELVFGRGSEIVKAGRVVTAQTPGGTGALRIAGELVRKYNPNAKLWLSDPTWANHNGIFSAAGFGIKTYPYYDAVSKGLNFEAMLAALETAAGGDIILLHGCCHNPTGIDPKLDQWKEVARVLAERRLLPLIDFAYQGLAEGLEEDAAGVRYVCAAVPEAVICSSFSKNFGLYNERAGALTVMAANADAARKALSHTKTTIRQMYSNPPSHGGRIVTTIMNDPQLRAEWELEVKEMRDRIRKMRAMFVDTLMARGVAGDFSFIKKQNGMFSFSGLSKVQVD
ncbi:MAG TPA: amino acid aminotransferase, partial [Sedimentisphaerales bacterium]|nr:amino acid aminotransferase [Sedimentisphaerales bacterium]